MPRRSKSLMSRKAVSDDALVIAAHLALVNLPSKPSSRRLTTLRWRSFMGRSEEHTSELQSLMRISYAVFCLKKKKKTTDINAKHDRSITQQKRKNVY